MIQIVVLLFLFLLYASQREGLRNANSITVNDGEYGVNPESMYKKLTIPENGNTLYEEKYKKYVKSDVLLDMQYFNNASQILFELETQTAS